MEKAILAYFGTLPHPPRGFPGGTLHQNPRFLVNRCAYLARARRYVRSPLNSPYPDRGAGVLNSSEVLAVPGELASPYLSAGLCPDRRSIPRPAGWCLFFDFLGFFRCLKKRSKNGPSKNRIFPEILAIFGASDVDFRQFWVPKRISGGSSGRVFRPFFPDAVLHRVFVVFSVNNVKLEKMKKCVSICKLHTIPEVAPSKKIRCLREKTPSV